MVELATSMLEPVEPGDNSGVLLIWFVTLDLHVAILIK